jgi:hypothetical protein
LQVETVWQLPFVQVRPSQHVTPLPQPWPRSAQVEPDWQVPDVAPPGTTQLPAQQSAVPVQVAPSPRQGGLQKPASQFAEQQSESAPQAVPLSKHPQNLLAPEPLQSPKQQSASVPQLCVGPFGLQVLLVPGSRQREPNSSVSVQAFAVPFSLQQGVPAGSQDEPNGMHVVVGGVQRSTPSPPGTHGLPLQHWSRNWQTSPVSMQQFGSFES